MNSGAGITEFRKPAYRTSWWFVGIGILVAVALIGTAVWIFIAGG